MLESELKAGASLCPSQDNQLTVVQTKVVLVASFRGGKKNPFLNLNMLFKNWQNLPQRVSFFGNRTALG